MGAQFNSINFPAMSTTELKKKFADYQEDERIEYGSNPYSGTMANCRGLDITGTEFKTECLADDWLSENAQKWGAALAVKVGNFLPIFPVSKKDQTLVKNYNDTKESLENFEINVAKRAKLQKSAKKTCPHCGSSISLKHLEVPTNWKAAGRMSDFDAAIKFSGRYYLTSMRQVTDCPVCNHNMLLTETDTKQKKALELKFKDLQVKVNQARTEYDKKVNGKQGSWLIGAWCAS